VLDDVSLLAVDVLDDDGEVGDDGLEVLAVEELSVGEPEESAPLC